MDLPIDRYLNLVQFFATEGMEDSEREKFETRLNMPVPGTAASAVLPADSPWSPENEASALSAFAAQVAGG